MAELNEILPDNNDLISDEDLLKYLDKNIPAEEKHALEKRISAGGFESDALEGLQMIKSGQIENEVKLLNQKLQQQLQNKKFRKDKSKIKDFDWIVLSILILLFICIAGYLIIRML